MLRWISLYDDNTTTFLRQCRVYRSDDHGLYIRFNNKLWYLPELVKLSDTDYALPEGRLIET